MIGEFFLIFFASMAIMLMWNYRKKVKLADQHALEQEIELDFTEELNEKGDRGYGEVLEWIEDQQVEDTIIKMNAKKY